MLLVSTTRIIPGRAVPSFLSGRYSAVKVRKKLYVTGESSFWRAWKGYDFKALDRLQDQGLIAFRRANKSVELTDEGFLLGDALAAAFRAEMAQTLTNL